MTIPPSNTVIPPNPAPDRIHPQPRRRLAAAYAAFFNGGRRVTPYGIEGKGQAPVQVIEHDEAAMMVRMLRAVVTRGTGRAAGVAGRAAAGKTGTTQDYRDAWFIGGANGIVIGVWLGNDDGSPMRDVMGGGLPARLFHDILSALPKGLP